MRVGYRSEKWEIQKDLDWVSLGSLTWQIGKQSEPAMPVCKEVGRGGSRQREEVRWRMGKLISVLYYAELILGSKVSNG